MACPQAVLWIYAIASRGRNPGVEGSGKMFCLHCLREGGQRQPRDRG